MNYGKRFEDALMDGLEDWIGDDGVVMLRKQSWSTRRGQFQMAQECDILVDSPNSDYYLGFECKTLDYTNSKGKYGFYFSQLNPDQFKKQRAYAEQSGRDVVVAVEARNYGPSKVDTAWVVPLSLFITRAERGDSKVGWDDMEAYGFEIGTDGMYYLSRRAIDHALALDDEMCDNPAFFDADADSLFE